MTIVSLMLTISMPIISYAQAVDGTAGNPNPDTQTLPPSTDGQSGDPSQSGQTGSGGLNGGQQAPAINGDGTQGGASQTPATVNTGDANSSTNSGTQTNTNTVTTDPNAGTTSGGTTQTGGWYQKWHDEMCRRHPIGDPKRPHDCPIPTTTITTGNTATVDAQATTTAGTGGNVADASSGVGAGGNALINTGDATAFGNAINVVNTNIINSSGMLLFLNLLLGGSTDLRNLDLSYFFGGGGTQSGCSLTGCGSNLNVNADNTATVTNSLVVRADTGANAADANGDATINTGNAYAAGNAVNLVNTNIIDSNYLLVTMNSFGNLGQDITLPGADFFSKLLAMQGGGVGGGGGSLGVNANNTATVGDGTNATASSGSNGASTGDGTTAINSGNAISSATSFNQVNTNLIGGTQVFMLFRIWGDWSGNIQGLPAGMKWEQTPFGIVLENADGSPASTGALKGACTVSCNNGSTNVNATNTAALGNNVNVFALTGANEVNSASGTAAINTGNAYASANSVNMVNTNLIGQNWIFMIFNIFGNFSGNISFGHPDLWIGASAETGNPTVPGSDVTYHFTVANRGDSDATNVRLDAKFARDLLHFADGVPTSDGMAFSLGNIPHGSTREFIYRATAGNVPDGVSAAATLEASVSSAETDNNPADNTEHLDLVIQKPAGQMFYSKSVTAGGYEPKITMTKTANVTSTSTPAMVDYVLEIKNDGGDASSVHVNDTLRGPTGGFVGDQEWDLGTVKANEDIKITYTVRFGKDIALGTYTNTARLTGRRGLAIAIDDVVTTNVIKIIAADSSTVLGAADVKECSPYLTQYLKQGGSNDPAEVTKLQHFLATNEGANVEESGVFDTTTLDAVKAFQAKHADEILTPWGMTRPSGSVYLTTEKAINQQMCAAGDYNLSPDQLNEINSFKAAPPSVQDATVRSGNVGTTKKKNVLMPGNVTVPVFTLPKAPTPTNGLGQQIKSLTSWLLSASR